MTSITSSITYSPSTVKLIADIFNRNQSFAALLHETQHGLCNAVDRDTPEELIFRLFKVPNNDDQACVGKLLSVLKSFGLREDDPRLQPMMEKVRGIELEEEEADNEARDPNHWQLNKEQFKRCISLSVHIIVKALRNKLIVPSWNAFCQRISTIYSKCASATAGEVATYIPQLARQNPNRWGVSICTVDGQRVSYGDSKTPFCLQSISKAFNYAILASDLGATAVHSFVGQEPSGRHFNDICLDGNSKPHNPMLNSGAIVISSMIKSDMLMADRFDYVLNEYKKLAGGEFVGFDNATFLSERDTADRNYALAFFMKEHNCFPKAQHSISSTLDFYFQLCSLEATCESAAVMAATLANGGVCPLTDEKCIENQACRNVLSLMYSCGMYDYSGQFAFHVGMPAKSGVSGGLVVVIPNLMGICLWSPPLDEMGNSVRGVEFCKELINTFKFHNYDSLLNAESQKYDPRKMTGDSKVEQIVLLLFAAKSGDISAIRRYYMQGVDLEMADYDGRTALHLAASEGHTELVKFLYNMQGVDLEMADYDGRTALHLAASEGHTELVKFLLNIAKVDNDPKDRWQRTPLDDAITFEFEQCAKILQKARDRVQKKFNSKGWAVGGDMSEGELSETDDDSGTCGSL
uniref:glutaminase n=1 Tax=Plectus sambesii TaxID=2011161 RepID=A0A914W569_9BILA